MGQAIVKLKVVSVNEHKLDQAEVDAIRKKQSDKITLESEITELEKSIDKRKEELNSRKFNSETDRRSVKNQLDTLVREKSSKSSLYASIVKELAVIGQQKPAALDVPKYRVRGFFGMPNPKQSDVSLHCRGMLLSLQMQCCTLAYHVLGVPTMCACVSQHGGTEFGRWCLRTRCREPFHWCRRINACNRRISG